MPVLESKNDRYGKRVGYKFTPTAAMLVAVSQRVLPEYCRLSEAAFLVKIGMGRETLKRWRNIYFGDKDEEKDGRTDADENGDGIFSRWWVESLEVAAAPMKSMLEMVGKIKAAEGEAAFWVPLAKTYGVVKPEIHELKIQAVPQELAGYDNLTREQLEQKKRFMLAALRGVDQRSGVGVAGPTDEAESSELPEGVGDRVGELQEQRVALPDALGDDRGHARQTESDQVISEQATLVGADPILVDVPETTDSEVETNDGNLVDRGSKRVGK